MLLPTLDQVDAELAARSLREFTPMAWPVFESVTYKPNWHIDAICDHLQAVSDGELKRLIINIPPRHAKPVDEYALVLMADGSRRALKDIQVGDRVIGHSGKPRKVLAIAEQGVLPVLRISTSSGREVTAAPDHPFLTPEGWRRADELRIGQALACVANAELEGRGDAREAAMAGYFVGDGCCVFNKSGSLSSNITAFDPGIAARIVSLCDSLGWKATPSTAPGRLNISGGVRPWLRSVGLAGKGSWTKRVPDFVMTGGRECVAAFLGAYFECDGTLNQRGGARKDLAVTFNSVSRDLLADTQHLLLRLGVRSKLRKHVGSSNFAKTDEYVSWRLTMTSRDDVATFASQVPIVGAKHARISEWAPMRSTFSSGLLSDLIQSIEQAEPRRCRCLTVADDESFTAEDLVVHNSSTVAVLWPCWEWLRRPETRWLFVSYAQTLSKRDSLKCRRIVESRGGRREGGTLIERVGYQGVLRLLGEDWRLAGDQNEKMRFENTRTGYRIATSVGGTATGEGGDILVVDDPHKADEVESEVERDNVIDFLDGTLSTRLNDPQTGRIVVVMQRLHAEDATGHLLEQGGYTHLCLPAEYTPSHPFIYPAKVMTESGTELQGDERAERVEEDGPGELLWPNHFTREAIDGLKTVLGSYRSAGQLQQLPAPAEGGILKTAWWQYYDPGLLARLDELAMDDEILDPGRECGLPHFTRLWESWDTALKEKTTSDFCVGGLWAQFGPQRYLLRKAKGRWGLTDTVTAMVDMTAWAKRRFPGLTPTIFVENKANGPEVIAAARGKVQGIVPVNPSQDKVVRAEAVTPQFEGGNVWVPGGRKMTENGWAPDTDRTPAWVQETITECAGFPNAANDDEVDMVSQALNPVRLTGEVKSKKKDRPKRETVSARMRRGGV